MTVFNIFILSKYAMVAINKLFVLKYTMVVFVTLVVFKCKMVVSFVDFAEVVVVGLFKYSFL